LRVRRSGPGMHRAKDAAGLNNEEVKRCPLSGIHSIRT
jgi:hypothetical protein